VGGEMGHFQRLTEASELECRTMYGIETTVLDNVLVVRQLCTDRELGQVEEKIKRAVDSTG
jgi:hypothetical protein